MKIDNISHLPTAGRVEQNKSGEKAGNTTTKSEVETESTTHLSHVGGDTSQDIDQGRVAELRQAISDGRLHVDTDRIADRLIASARDLVGKQP